MPELAQKLRAGALIARALDRVQQVRAFLRILLVAAFALPWGFLGVVAWRTYGSALSDAQTQVQRMVDVLHEHTLKVFETEDLILDEAVSRAADLNLDRKSDRDRLNEMLKSLQSGRDQIASMWVLDKAGHARAASVPWTEPLNGSDRDYFQAHVDGHAGSYIGKAFVGRATGQASFGMSRPLPSPDGSFRGIVSISISSDYFRDFFRRAAPDIEHTSALMRSDGSVLARDPADPSLRPLAEDDPLMRALAVADRSVLWRTSPVDNIERLYGYRRVSGYPLVVSFAVTRSAVLRPWGSNLLLYTAIASIATAALAGLAVFALRATRREEVALVWLSEESRQREEIEAQLKQAQKLEALGRLTSTVAHDFGNLLNPILGNLQLLKLRPDPARSQSRIADALAAAERGEKLIRSLLAFAREQPLTLIVVDVNTLIGEMEALLRQALGPSSALTFQLAADLWPVRADASQVEMAVLNLVVNARDAMPGGGKVTISTANTPLRGGLNSPSGDFVAIAVSDTGSGMSPDVLARAFEPFFTTKGPGKGTGLGLSSIYGFAKQCGGTVAIDSEVGEGTAVTVYLPRAAESV